MLRLAFAMSLAAVHPAAAQMVSLEQYLAVPAAKPDAGLTYGPAAPQGIDVFLPKGPGPHPTVILIHGGCWDRNIPGREQVRGLANDLRGRGLAVWSIGYRRANEDGGGYPGTFQDVSAAVDRARTEAKRFNLDLSRSVLVGHSAGGHLALWAAGRAKLPPASPAHVANPFVPPAVISLAGIGNLRAAERLIPVVCGPGILEALTGKPSGTRKEVWADTSPARLLPNAPVKILVSGVYDDVVPPYAAMDYALPARKAGQELTLVNIPDSGHFDMVTPGAPAYAEVVSQIEAAVARP